MMKRFLCLVVLALAIHTSWCLKPSRIGDLIPSGSPGSVSGLVFLLNHTALYIRDFHTDLNGYFCAGGSTSNVSDSYAIADGSSSFSFSSGFSTADIELSLPAGVTVASLAWVGVCGNSDPSPVLASVVVLPQLVSNVPCNTILIGELPSDSNNISGRVYLLDRITFAVLGFSYDGMAPDAFFWVGAGDTPSISGYPATYGDNVVTPLPSVSDQDMLVYLPEAARGTEVTYLAIWCRSNNVNLAHITVMTGLIPTPAPPPMAPSRVLVGSFTTRAHRVSGRMYALDERTVMLTQFYFDGNAPGAYFWAVRGSSVRSSNYWIVPDETGSSSPLTRAYNDRTITLTLPDEITIHTIDYFSVWCRPFRINFGEVVIPDNIVLPGSVVVEVPTIPPLLPCPVLTPQIPVNCKQLSNDVTVSWVVDSSNNFISIKLCGCVLPDNYIAFGISGSDQAVQMVGGDATWTWLDNEGVHAQDLHLSAYSQCLIERQPSGQLTQSGACPDMQDDVTSVSGFRDGCTTCISFARPLNTSDPTDRPFLLGQEQYVIWSVGPVGSLSTPLGTTIPVPFRHYANADRTANLRVNFSRPAVDECTLQCSQCEVQVEPWPQPVLPHTTTITARIGQSGGERGYAGITGTSGWGISWYLNGLLIPNITMYRDTTYTFIVEGGLDPSNQARYHPFYITNSDRGGYLAKSTAERQLETVFAGIDGDTATPLGVGRYCEYMNVAGDRSNEFTSFDQYMGTLSLECDDGQPGTFTWTPDENTPDIVYYQCATHQFLGWKIDIKTACPAGMYRSRSDPSDSCLSCPANTIGTTVTFETCPCIAGYFRAPQEGQNVACTQPPTAVRNLTVTDTTDNSITLQWDPPFVTGRQDYYFVVEYSDPDNNSRYIRHNTNSLTSTFYTLDHLRSVTTYAIRVSVHNGVSDQDEQNADMRVVEISARTEEERPGPPSNVEGLCTVVLWGQPSQPNGEVIGFSVQFYVPGVWYGTLYRKQADDIYHIVQDSDIPSDYSDSEVSVGVRAITRAGEGVWTNVSLGCEEINTTPEPVCPTETCPTCPPEVTCQPTPECTCPPTVTCPTCPPVFTCPPVVECPTVPVVTCPTQPPVIPPPQPAQIEVVDIFYDENKGTKLVAWNIPEEEVTTYSLRISYYDIFMRQLYLSSKNPWLQLQVTDLPNQRPIWIEVRARNSGGSAPWSSLVELCKDENEAN